MSTAIRSRVLPAAATYLVLTAGAAIFVVPLLWLLGASLMPKTQNPFTIPPSFLPHQFTLSNYVEVFQHYNFARYLLNSFIVAVLAVGTQLLVCSLCAYPLARMQFRGRTLVFALIIATLVLPSEGTLIPTFIMLVQFHMVNNYAGLVVPGMMSTFNVFFLRQAYLQIPRDLEDAARIDGAGDVRIFARIALPMIRPALTAMAILGFLASWDAFLWPLIVLNDQNLYTAPLGLSYLQGMFGGSWQVIAAGSVIVALPVVLLFAFFQRYFVSGIAGALRG